MLRLHRITRPKINAVPRQKNARSAQTERPKNSAVQNAIPSPKFHHRINRLLPAPHIPTVTFVGKVFGLDSVLLQIFLARLHSLIVECSQLLQKAEDTASERLLRLLVAKLEGPGV